MARFKFADAASQASRDFIISEGDTIIGTVRVKPSGVCWKPINEKRYFRRVEWERFIDWITNPKTRVGHITH